MWSLLLVLAGPPAKPFREVALAPDGARIAWIGPENASDTRSGGFLIRGVSGGPARRIMVGPEAGEHDLAWSPDGKSVAFVATGASGLQIYLATAATGAVRKLTSLKGFAAAPRWSPDGGQVAFLVIENAQKAAGPLVAAARDTGVIGHHADYQRIAVADPRTGRVRIVSPADLYVHEYQWSPDGQRFAASAGAAPGDNGWYTDQIYVVDVAAGAARSLGKPGTQIASPVWSPDGTRIAYLGALMSDEVAPAGDIFVVPAAGGAPKNLTPGLGISPHWLAWPAGSSSILFSAWADGGTALGSVDPSSGTVTTKWSGAEQIRALGGFFAGSVSLAKDGVTTALIRHGFDRPPEIWVGPIGGWTQATRANAGLTATWGTAKSLHWASDRFQVQGWLLEPAKRSSGGAHPMVVVVHGGPAAMHVSHWLSSAEATELALLENGYYVFLPNPRGSQGFGAEFTSANVKDLGSGDLRDILGGVDQVLKSAPVDSAAIGVTGWSYGGYMTMWAVTQTRRFSAGVAGAGVANWQSYWAQNGINEWLSPYFGGVSVYDDPAGYAKSAPITYIKQVKTPTLVLVGERDIETPAPQSYEFWKGLDENGVPTELVVYADEGHGIRQPAHVKDRIARTLGWFDRYLKRKAVP